MQYKCFQCGTLFEGKTKSHIYKFCSHKCYSKSLVGRDGRRKEKIKRTGYWYIFSPNHPMAGKQKYVAEHRIIMEKYLGRYLKKQEVVHHINGNTLDNRLENLELFSSHGQHTKLAHPEIREKQKIIFKGKHFSPLTEFKKAA